MVQVVVRVVDMIGVEVKVLNEMYFLYFKHDFSSRYSLGFKNNKYSNTSITNDDYGTTPNDHSSLKSNSSYGNGLLGAKTCNTFMINYHKFLYNGKAQPHDPISFRKTIWRIAITD